MNSVTIEIHGQQVPSFKNRKHSGVNGHVFTEPKVKDRMQRLEDSILSALYSWSQTTASATPLECLKQLRTFLYELYDDSLREIPMGSWAVERVPKGQEGVRIIITEICQS